MYLFVTHFIFVILLSEHEHGNNNNNNNKHTNKFDNISDKKVEMAFSILNEVFDALQPQLTVRIEQIWNSDSSQKVLESNETVIYYRLAHLLELYVFTLGKLLGKSSNLPMFLSVYVFFSLVYTTYFIHQQFKR